MFLVQLFFSFAWALQGNVPTAIELQPWNIPGRRTPPVESFVGVYANGIATPIVPLIKAARSRIDVAIYEMKDPEFISTLQSKVNMRGFQIRIVKDDSPVGKSCRYLNKRSASEDCKPLFNLFKLLQESPNKRHQFVAFDKQKNCKKEINKGKCFQHGKLMIVDRKVALISTGNFNPTSLCNLKVRPPNCNRDYTVVTADPQIVKALIEIFENDLAGTVPQIPEILKYYNVEDKLTVSPYSYEPIARLITSATSRIQFQNQYIYKDSGLGQLLGDMAEKRVKIEIQLSDVCSHGPKISQNKGLELNLMFRYFDDMKMRVRMYNRQQKVQNKPGYLHAKAIVVDETVAWIGSVNGSKTSIDGNREFGIFVRDPVIVKALSQRMSEDIEDPAAQTWRDSMTCRHKVGWKNPEAMHVDGPEYLKLLNKWTEGPKAEQPKPNEDDDDDNDNKDDEIEGEGTSDV